MANTVKQELHVLAEALPDSATWDDVIEQARFRQAVQEGISAAERNDFATPEEVAEVFARWGVKA